MEISLILIGIVVGSLSGFFGIGGGTILVPTLILMGYDIKAAVGISVMQMVFSSLYGSWLNHRKGNLNLKDGLVIGFGGFVGALGSGWLVSSVPEIVLESMFVAVVLFALYRFFHTSANSLNEDIHTVPSYILGIVGAFIGLFAISMGIGGSILLTPILVGFLHYPLKKAVSAGLFFVVFSSISGFISLSISGHIDYIDGLVIGIASLLGVQIGIWIASKTGQKKHKNALIVLYVIILVLMLKKLFGI
ncbi:sulfite exporter TauE/SafE family protein [Hydrogenimonas thermophila]|uniref:sulfite exporter TauE/SafE family protein n=1 Tax=Hydrogenimonas thermophila TaxID=223786 RepID=UPI00293729DD|nr:sulfite exporter TauE/SafE family protein [Hydrogenimonas thermophila]WOE70910.1 sulfite exporter TauE/SafE family protein [Hydrogenimonas thermophila]WOE73428.1 sulfite exporter TauE/SafE family protein [Hydrogenimonas thermophila]